MQNAEIKKIIEASFEPYHCGVEFLPIDEPVKTSLQLRVSDEFDELVFIAKSNDLEAVREDLDQYITWCREAASKKGFKLDPLGFSER